MSSESSLYIAGDIGGSNGRLAVYEGLDAKEPLKEMRFNPTQNTGGKTGDYNKDFQELLRICRQLQSEVGSISGISIAAAGKINAARTGLLTAGNLDHWSGKPFVQQLGTAMKVPVRLCGDVRALALAEKFYGMGQRARFRGVDFLMIGYGTGIGGCMVRHHEGGFIPIDGEYGHVNVEEDGRPCGCGLHGCLEAYAGGNGILNHFGKPAEELSREEWLTVAPRLAVGFGSILAPQPVDLVVFNGGLINGQAWLLPYLEELLKHPMHGSPELRLSRLGDSAGLLGALLNYKLWYDAERVRS